MHTIKEKIPLQRSKCYKCFNHMPGRTITKNKIKNVEEQDGLCYCYRNTVSLDRHLVMVDFGRKLVMAHLSINYLMW